MNLVNDANKADNLPLLLILPALRFLMPKLTGWTQQQKVNKLLQEMSRGMIREHLETYNPDEPPRDYIDAYISHMKDPERNQSGEFNEDHLSLNIIDLFIAGSETTATTLNWLVR